MIEGEDKTWQPPSDAVESKQDSSSGWTPPTDALEVKKKEESEDSIQKIPEIDRSIEPIAAESTSTPQINLPPFREVDKKATRTETMKQVFRRLKEDGHLKEEDEEFSWGTWVDEQNRSLNRGLAMVAGQIASIPENVYDIFAIPQNIIADYTGWDIGTSSDEFMKNWMGVEDKTLVAFPGVSVDLDANIVKSFYNKVEESWEPKSKLYDVSIESQIEKGDYIGATANLSAKVTEQIPNVIALMMMGSLGSKTEVFAGTTAMFYDDDDEDINELDIPESSKSMAKLSKAALEGITEAMFTSGAGRYLNEIFKKEGKEEAGKVANDLFQQVYSKYKVPGSMLGEGAEEWTNQVLQNLVDINAGVEDRGVFDGSVDALLIGMGTGGATGTTVAAVEKLAGGKSPSKEDLTTIRKSNPDQVAENIKQRVDDGSIEKQAGEELARVYEENKDLLDKIDESLPVKDQIKAAQLMKERNDAKIEIDGLEVVSPEKKEKIDNLNQQIKEITISESENKDSGESSNSEDVVIDKDQLKDLRVDVHKRKTDDIRPDEFESTEQYEDWVLENSQDIDEIAEVYLSNESNPQNELEGWQQDLIGQKFSKKSLREFGDINKINDAGKGFAMNWIGTKKSNPTSDLNLDTVAQELSSVHGVEITPEDIWDFVISNPNGVRRTKDIMQSAKARYKDISGGNKVEDHEFKSSNIPEDFAADLSVRNAEDLTGNKVTEEDVEKARGLFYTDKEADLVIEYLKNRNNAEQENQETQPESNEGRSDIQESIDTSSEEQIAEREEVDFDREIEILKKVENKAIKAKAIKKKLKKSNLSENEKIVYEQMVNDISEGSDIIDEYLKKIEDGLDFRDTATSMGLPLEVARLSVVALRKSYNISKNLATAIQEQVEILKKKYSDFNENKYREFVYDELVKIDREQRKRRKKVDVVKEGQESGLTEDEALRQGWAEYRDSYIIPMRRKIQEARKKIREVYRQKKIEENQKKRQILNEVNKIREDIIKAIEKGVDNKFISQRTFNALSRRLTRSGSKKGAETALDYVEKAIEESKRNYHRSLIDQMGKYSSPKKLKERRKSGIVKGKVSQYEMEFLNTINYWLPKKGETPNVEDLQDFIHHRVKMIGSALKLSVHNTAPQLDAANLLVKAFNSVDGAIEALSEVKLMLKQGRDNIGEILMKKGERYRENANIVLDSVTAGEGVPSQFELKARKEETKSLINKMKRSIDSFLDSQSSFRFLMDKIDRGDRKEDSQWGKMDNLYQWIADSRREKDNLDLETFDEIQKELVKIYGSKKALKKALSDNVKQQYIGKFDNVDGETVDITMSQNQAYHLYNTAKNQDSLDILYRMGWTSEMLEAVQDFLTPQVKKWADWQVESLYPKIYDQVNSVYNKMNYIDLPKIENYVPRRRESASRGFEASVDGFVNNNSTADYGSLKERMDTTTPLDLSVDGDSILFQHIQQSNHYTAFAQTIKDLNAIFTTPKIREAIKLNNSNEALKIIDEFIQDIAMEGRKGKEVFKVLDKLRSWHTTSSLAINPVVTIKQLTSGVAGIADIGAKNFSIEFAKAMANPKKSYEIAKMLLQDSAYLKTRYKKGFDRDMAIAMARDYKKTFSGASTLFDKLMFNVKYGDAGGVLLSGVPLYNHHYKNGLKTMSPAEARKYAIKKVEESTKMAQQSTNIEDQSALQRGGQFAKAFTMYMTSPIQYMTQARKGIRDIYRGAKEGDKARMKDGVRRFVVYHMLLPLLFQWVANAMPGVLSVWDDEDDTDMLRAMSIGSLNGLFILGDMLNYFADLVTGKPWARKGSNSFTPLFDNLNDATYSLHKLLDEVVNDVNNFEEVIADELMDFSVDMGDLFGLPAGRIEKSVESINNASDSWDDYSPEQKTQVFLGYSPFVIEKDGQERRKQNKNSATIFD